VSFRTYMYGGNLGTLRLEVSYAAVDADFELLWSSSGQVQSGPSLDWTRQTVALDTTRSVQSGALWLRFVYVSCAQVATVGRVRCVLGEMQLSTCSGTRSLNTNTQHYATTPRRVSAKLPTPLTGSEVSE
jgi:hypothetical protein